MRMRIGAREAAKQRAAKERAKKSDALKKRSPKTPTKSTNKGYKYAVGNKVYNRNGTAANAAAKSYELKKHSPKTRTISSNEGYAYKANNRVYNANYVRPKAQSTNPSQPSRTIQPRGRGSGGGTGVSKAEKTNIDDQTETYEELYAAIRTAINYLTTASTEINNVTNGVRSAYITKDDGKTRLSKILSNLNTAKSNTKKLINELIKILERSHADFTGLTIVAEQSFTDVVLSDNPGNNENPKIKPTADGMIDLTGKNKTQLKNLKIQGKICITDVPFITSGKGVQNQSYFKHIYLPDKYVATPTHVEPMHYVASMNKKMTVKLNDGTTLTIKKGEKVVLVRGGNQKKSKSNLPVTCVIQTGANKGKTFTVTGNDLKVLQQLTDSSVEYTKKTAEKYVNTYTKEGNPAKSNKNYLLWVNTYTQRMYYFTRKNANSSWVLTKYPVDGFQNSFSAKISTGAIDWGGNGYDTKKKYKQLGSHMRNL